MTKADFLQNELVSLLVKIPVNAAPLWGKMNVQNMVEHMSDSVRIANGRDPQDCITPDENLPKMQAFLYSDKPFKENTPNSLMPDTPAPSRFERMEDALGELQSELNEFINVFSQDKRKINTNPFFGPLDFEAWTLLLYKHALHHLRQFGVVPDFTVES
ncbi:MAG: hypothetical protein ABI378_14245 [Chitinophagaceae bacterium]